MLTVVRDDGWNERDAAAGSPSVVDEIVREGARRMLAEALQAEVDAYIARFAGERDEQGRRLVVRNGYHQPREVVTSAGAVEVTVPRVHDKRADPVTGERMRFSSAILPPWARKIRRVRAGASLEGLYALPLRRPGGRGLSPPPGHPAASWREYSNRHVRSLSPCELVRIRVTDAAEAHFHDSLAWA